MRDRSLAHASSYDFKRIIHHAAQVDKKVFSAAWGKNKKQAEQRAAANALAELAGKEIPYADDGPA